MCKNIVRKLDGSYIVDKDGMPYHVPKEGEWAAMWQEIHDYTQTFPDIVTEETPPTPPTKEELNTIQAASIRAKRDSLLAATDYLLMPDYPISESDLVGVKAYRQALRDVPSQTGFPEEVNWPVEPDLIAE